jgi:hypothetical protein
VFIGVVQLNSFAAPPKTALLNHEWQFMRNKFTKVAFVVEEKFVHPPTFQLPRKLWIVPAVTVRAVGVEITHDKVAVVVEQGTYVSANLKAHFGDKIIVVDVAKVLFQLDDFFVG